MTFRERAFVPVLLLLGGVVSIVSSLGAPLIPEIARQLGTSLANAQWALTATLVVAAVASPVLGRLGDGRHRRQVILGAMALVVLGGGLAATAQSLAPLIVGRALQGLGLALMPLTMAAARAHLPAERAGRVIAALSVVGAAGVGLGYPITGFIADHGGVAAAYWFGTAATAVALVLAVWAVPSPQGETTRRSLDLPGALLIGLGLVGLLVGLDKAPEWGWSSASTLGLIAVGLLLLGAWTAHELRTSEPLVDLRLVRHRPVATANLTGLLLGVAMYLSMVLITQAAQLPVPGFGASVFVAGLTLVPLSVCSALASRALPAVERRIGARAVLPAGALLVAGATLLFALSATSLTEMFFTTAVLGLGLGFTFAAMPGLIVRSVPAEETGSAMGFYQVSRFVGFALGSGLAVTFLRAFAADPAAPLVPAYRATALVAAGIAALTAAAAWLATGRDLPPRAARREAVEALERRDGLLASAGAEDESRALRPATLRG